MVEEGLTIYFYLEKPVIGLNGYGNAESIMKRWDSDSSFPFSLGFSSNWTTLDIATKPVIYADVPIHILYSIFVHAHLPKCSLFSHNPPNS